MFMAIAGERVRAVFKKVERDLSNLASEQRAENVHSFRTSTRRLQTLLEELIAERNRNQKKLLKLLDGIRRRAGKVRNIDVQLAALRSVKIAQEPRRKTQLTQALLELRAKHEKKLRKALTKQNIGEIEKRIRRVAEEFKNKKEAQGKVKREAGRDPLLVARTIMARALVSRAASKAALDESSLHERRILIKRARYAAEFAPKSAEATQIISQLQRLQDALGNWHDWQSLTNTAQKRLGDVRQSSLVAALHNTTGGKLRSAMAALTATVAEQVSPKVVIPPPTRALKAMVKPSSSSEQADSAA
jgi:CHAD domain-containing protein